MLKVFESEHLKNVVLVSLLRALRNELGGYFMTLKDYKEKRMQDPEFAAIYIEIESEMNAICAMIEEKRPQNISRKATSERSCHFKPGK